MKSFRVAIIQNRAGANWKRNLRGICDAIQVALRKKPHLIALPEAFYYRGSPKNYTELASKVTPEVIRTIKQIAKKRRTAVLLGSVLESSNSRHKFFNTSLLISESGRIAGKYRKIHLFDNKLPQASSQESKHLRPGRRTVAAKVHGIPVGLSVCYDLRFPELYRELTAKRARIITVPANFTEKTGRAHWEVLLRARAIENQVFIIAPGQVGTHPVTGIRSFGTSLIVDPWGKVLVRGHRSKEQVLFATLDLRMQSRLRKAFPVLSHRRL